MSPPNPNNGVLSYGDKALSYGDEAVKNRVTDYDNVLMPTKKGTSPGKLVLIVANGYSGYKTVGDEIAALEGGYWLPHTQDFLATAADSGINEPEGASTANEFFAALQGVSGKISRIVFIGHGSSTALGLSGTPLDFFGETLDSNDLKSWQEDIDRTIKPKLNKDAKIDLIACNDHAGKAFVKDMANALGICVRYFPEAVMWCVSYDETKKVITGRGRLGPQSRVGDSKNCSQSVWYEGVKKLIPPEKECPSP
jgi:hypothetical protein